MGSSTRRDFLRQCAATAPVLFFNNRAAGHLAPNPPGSAAPPLERFVDPLPILQRIRPVASEAHADHYRVRMQQAHHRMHSQLPPTTIWGYEGRYPGPLFDVERNRPIVVQWENHLPTQHIFTVDPNIHGAMPPSPAVRTVPHLHGSRTRSESDGLPEKWFTPGVSVLYHYPNCQPAATLWYHDHALGITRLNVYAGLSGLYLLRDEQERSMHLPSGDYEVPLILQDRDLDPNGQLLYSPTWQDGQNPGPGVWAPEFFGGFPVVNGAIAPCLEVEPRLYRLRLLNGANSRYLNLYCNLAKNPTDIPSLVTFHQIGTDGGFLPQPVALTHLLLGPAERADLLIDFSPLEGRTITLSNNASAPYPGWAELNSLHPHLDEWMQFRVSRPLSPTPSCSLPASIPFSRLHPATSLITRDFILSEEMDAQGHSLGVRINHRGYNDPVTEFVQLGSTERWRFINTTDDAHPMHLHLVQFQILERQGFSPEVFARGQVQMIGIPRPPAASEAGWKDTAIVNPGDVLSILVRFEGYSGRYVFHCHMLEHEDNDMMRPYVVVSPKAVAQPHP